MKDEIKKICDTLYSTHWMWELFAKDLKNSTTLVNFLSKKLPHIPSSSWPERFDWGGIFINGIPAYHDILLTPPCKVEYFEPKLPFSDMAKLYPSFEPSKHILFEDKDLLIVFKPAGLPSKPAKEQNKFSLLRSLENYTGKKIHMPSRLDVATAGLIAASKSKRNNLALQQLFERHEIRKFYLLEISQQPDKEHFTVNQPIGRDPRHPVLRRVTADGKTAITIFTKIYSTAKSCILLAELLTGRTHQIRVHSAFCHTPLIGDTFYNGAPADDLHLISYQLQMVHPFSKDELSITVPNELLPAWLNVEQLNEYKLNKS